MYRIGEIAKLADVTPDTIRYYEKQQMMEHEVRTEGGFRLYTESDLQRLKFIRYAASLVSLWNRSVSFFRSVLIPNTIPVRNQKGSSRKDCKKSKHVLPNFRRCSGLCSD